MNEQNDTPLRIVQGELTYFTSGTEKYPHVSWLCPACRKVHDTDLEPDDQSPLEMPCEAGRSAEIFRVSWVDDQRAEQTGGALRR